MTMMMMATFYNAGAATQFLQPTSPLNLLWWVKQGAIMSVQRSIQAHKTNYSCLVRTVDDVSTTSKTIHKTPLTISIPIPPPNLDHTLLSCPGLFASHLGFIALLKLS